MPARERSSCRHSKVEEAADEKAMSGIWQFVLDGVKILPNTNTIRKNKNSKHLKEDNSHSLTSHKLRQCQHFPPDSRLLSVRYINHIYYQLLKLMQKRLQPDPRRTEMREVNDVVRKGEFFIFEDAKFKSSQITNNYLEELQSLEVAYLFVDLFPLVV